MRARAPGKIVLSGAYSVLQKAPAIVSAVNRYAQADTRRTPDWIADEVREAFGDRAIPHADASALRSGTRKLGLGSSAAILVASLAAAQSNPQETLQALRTRLEQPAIRAHRRAQGGGSGVDVVTSVWGGTLIARRERATLQLDHVSLPSGLVVEVWASPYSTSTASMLRAVESLFKRDPGLHGLLFKQLIDAALCAAKAVAENDCLGLMTSLDRQCRGLAQLGEAANAPIVTAETQHLFAAAREEAATLLPAGAGGGDIVLWVGQRSSSADFRRTAQRLEHELLDVQLHAPGVHLVAES